jgi:hypothetical protein
MAIASSVSVLAIPKQSIDHNLARGLHDAKSHDAKATGDDRPSGLTVLLTCRPLLIFAGCAIMFHFANAAMLPLVGQKLALQDKNFGDESHVGVHRRRANRDGSHGNAGWREG